MAFNVATAMPRPVGTVLISGRSALKKTAAVASSAERTRQLASGIGSARQGVRFRDDARENRHH
jgi:hypothetical protein